MMDVGRVLSENRRPVWIIAAALLVNAALYALVVYPLAQRVQSGEQEAGMATRELVAARKAHVTAAGTVTGKKEADQELRKFYREVLPPDLSAARRILYPRLPQLARKANLQTSVWRIDPDPRKTGDLQKVTMTLTVGGEYANMRRFIHDLETAPEFLILESVVVTTEGEGERRLNLTAHVSTYYRTINGT